MIIPFPRRPVDANGHVFTVAVDDDLADTLPAAVVPMGRDAAARYVLASEAVRDGLVPEYWLSRSEPSRPDRRVLFETLATEMVEQDERGAIWVDGELLDDGLLLRVGSAGHDREGPLVEGESAALLLVSRSGARVEFAVRVTAPVLWVYEQPRCLMDTPVLLGWTGAAQFLWRERGCGTAGDLDRSFTKILEVHRW